MTKDMDKDKNDKNLFVFIDGEKYEPASATMTPDAIIAAATDLDASLHYLKRIEKGGGESYKDKGGIPIILTKGDRFQVISTGAMTVSCRD